MPINRHAVHFDIADATVRQTVQETKTFFCSVIAMSIAVLISSGDSLLISVMFFLQECRKIPAIKVYGRFVGINKPAGFGLEHQHHGLAPFNNLTKIERVVG